MHLHQICPLTAHNPHEYVCASSISNRFYDDIFFQIYLLGKKNTNKINICFKDLFFHLHTSFALTLFCKRKGHEIQCNGQNLGQTCAYQVQVLDH